MNISISMGNRALYAVYPDRCGSKRLVQNGLAGFFDMHLWCNGKKAYFGAAAIRQSVKNYALFFPELVTELRKPAANRNKYAFGKVRLGLHGMFALLFNDIKQRILADLLQERLILMISEPLLLTLVLPDDIYENDEARELIKSAFRAAGFQIKSVIPEYIAVVYAYNLNVNRSRQTIKVLHVDIGDSANFKYIEISEDGYIKLIARQNADIGIRPVEEMLRQHIESEFKQHCYTGHNNFPESLDQEERFEYESKLAQLTNSLMVSTDESLHFLYSTKQKEYVEIDVDLCPNYSFYDILETQFVFPTRMMSYLSSLNAVIANFVKINIVAQSIDKLVFSGAGCRFPTVVNELQKTLGGSTKTQLLRKNVDYSNVLAFGGSAYNDANDYESEFHPQLSDEEKKITDQINLVITEPWIIPNNPPNILEPDVRYEIPSNANHIRFEFSDKERINTKIELIIDGAKHYFDQNSSKQAGVELLDLNHYHICLSELKSSEVYFVAESDTELSNLSFFLEIADLLRDGFHHTLDSHSMKASMLKFKKIRLLKLYQHAGKWKITSSLEPMVAPLVRLPSSKDIVSPRPKPINSPAGATPIPAKPLLSDGGAKKMLEGERVIMQDSKYQVDISGVGVCLFTQLVDSENKSHICTSKTPVLDMAIFNSENSLTISLNLLERYNYKRAAICLAASGAAGIGEKFSCSIFSVGADLQNLVYGGMVKSKYSKVLEFYNKDGKWRLLGEVEALPDNTASSGLVENSDLTVKGTTSDTLVSGEKFTLTRELKILRVDFTGAITMNMNLAMFSLDAVGGKISVWRLKNPSQIIAQSDTQRAISLLFDLGRLMLDQYVCVSDNCTSYLDSLTFLDGESCKPFKRILKQRDGCINSCNYLFKLYKYKGVWKIGYMCD